MNDEAMGFLDNLFDIAIGVAPIDEEAEENRRKEEELQREIRLEKQKNIAEENARRSRLRQAELEARIAEARERKEQARARTDFIRKNGFDYSQFNNVKQSDKEFKHKEYRAGQTGVTYYDMFVKEIMSDVHQFYLIDPYLYTQKQLECLDWFIHDVRRVNKHGIRIFLHTSLPIIRDKDGNVDKIKTNSKRKSVIPFQLDTINHLAYKYNVEILVKHDAAYAHDRWIATDNNWMILLGQGLDIYDNHQYGLNYSAKQLRIKKAFHVTFFKEKFIMDPNLANNLNKKDRKRYGY